MQAGRGRQRQAKIRQSDGFHCYHTDFVWKVNVSVCRDKSNVFSFRGRDVYLGIREPISRCYSLFAGPPSIPSSLRSDIRVRVLTKNKKSLFLPQNNKSLFLPQNTIKSLFLAKSCVPNSEFIWQYSIDQILKEYPDFYEDGSVLTFVVCDVDRPKRADKCTGTSQDHWISAIYRKKNDIPDGRLMNLDSLSSDFANLLKSDKVSDVQLNCKGITRPAHRTVLAARSQVFSAMFQHKMAESASGIVDIGDLDVEVLDLFLQYVYSGKLPNIPEDKIHELYVAADKYGVHCLKKLCSDWMVENLSADNFTTFLMTADIHSHSEFKNTLIESIADHSEWFGRAKWLEFSKEHSILAVEVFQKHYDKKNKKA